VITFCESQNRFEELNVTLSTKTENLYAIMCNVSQSPGAISFLASNTSDSNALTLKEGLLLEEIQKLIFS